MLPFKEARQSSWLGLLAICVTAACHAHPSYGQEPLTRAAPNRLATHMTAFGMPFAIDDPQNQFVEVQLYVSKDRGQTWQFYGRQNLDAQAFPFQSSGDGEYWFAIKTLDRDRKLHPPGEMTAEQIVIVDTVRPTLDFRVQTDAAGRVVCRWRGEDANIDPHSVQLAYRPMVSTNEHENPWIGVPYRPVTEPQAGVFADQYAWWLETSSQEVLVRLTISDLAGNQVVEERQIAAPRVIMKSGQLAMSDPVQAAAELEANRQAAPQTPAALAEGAAANQLLVQDQSGAAQEYGKLPLPVHHQNPAASPVNSHLAPPQSANQQQASQSSNNIAWESVPRDGNSKQESSLPSWPQQAATATPLSGRDWNGTSAESRPTASNGEQQTAKITTDAATSRSAAPELLSTADRLVIPSQLTSGPQGESSPLSGHPANSLPPQLAEPPLSINSLRFRLDYDLGAIALGDVARVVLWVTRDRGQTWESYGEDPDNGSPMPVQVEGEGHYGFRIVVHTRQGLVGRTPARGDDADTWVRVDLQPPVARIVAAPYGRDQQAGHLVIQWQAVDEAFRNRPIHLSYAVSAEGPWTTIADGLDNSGSYAWKVDSSVPPRVHLRLDAVDAAGNVATSVTTDTVDLTGLVPQSRIIGVQPVK